jgi:hypothetical protein
VIAGDLVISHDVVALRGRIAGWRAARGMPRLAVPSAGTIDPNIGLRDSLRRRLGVYGRRAA